MAMRGSLLTRFFDLLSPRQCPGCGRRLMVSEETLCHRCLMHCPYTPFFEHPTDNLMARMFWGLFDLQQAVALFYYEVGGSMAQVIHQIKYFGRDDLAQELGALFARRLMATSAFFDGIDIIVPVPLSKERQRERGYNQSELIARGISEVSGLPLCLTALKRQSFKGSQTHLNAIERRENVERAFSLADVTSIEGKHVLLVDDVMTTGATLRACSLQLSMAKEVTISIATLGFTRS